MELKVEDSKPADKRCGRFGRRINERGKRFRTLAKRIRSESATPADSAFVPYEIW